MPNYPGSLGAAVPVASNLSPIALQKGESAYVFGQLGAGATQLPVMESNVAFEAASVNAIQASIAVTLPVMEDSPAPMVCVEVRTNGAAVAGESFAIQEADTDADAFYITPGGASYTISTFTANNTARADLSPTGGKFMRIARTKGANAVSCTVKLTRLA
jgi:hypothetical protein